MSFLACSHRTIPLIRLQLGPLTRSTFYIKAELRLISTMSQNHTVGPGLSGMAAWALKFSPSAWLKSWLLYIGIQTHVGSTMQPEMKPLHNICEYLHALHIYTDEARRGEVRTVCEATDVGGRLILIAT